MCFYNNGMEGVFIVILPSSAVDFLGRSWKELEADLVYVIPPSLAIDFLGRSW